MPSIGDIIQITTCSEVFTAEACNVFYLTVAAWTGNLTVAEALEAWRVAKWHPFRNLMTTGVVGTTVTWRNVDNPAEVVQIDNPTDGVVSGEVLAPFVAVSARLYGDTNETRSGWKRFPGIPETDSINGLISSGALTNWQENTENAFADFVEPAGPGPGADAWLINTIVGRTVGGALDLSRVQPITSIVVQPRVTTQNTRKVGRGS